MKNKKILYIFSTVLLVTVVIIGVSVVNPTIGGKTILPTSTVYATSLETINTNMNYLMIELEKEMTANPALGLMGSPIKIIEESEAYQEIINLGLEGVKPLYDKLYESREAGLYEYILALAIEDITKEEFIYNKDYGWKNSLEFRLSYETKVNNAQVNVERILNNEDLTDEEKTTKLKEQGIFAVSFLMDEYNNENSKSNKDMIEDAVLGIASSYKNTVEEKNVQTYSMDKNESSSIESIQEKYDLFKSLVDLNGSAYD